MRTHNRKKPARLGLAFILSMAAVGHLYAADLSKWNGQYENPKVAIHIAMNRDGAASGMIRMGDRHFSFQGRLDAGTLIGTFQNDGADYAFTATLSGEELTLLTGGVTLSLHRDSERPAGGDDRPAKRRAREASPRRARFKADRQRAAGHAARCGKAEDNPRTGAAHSAPRSAGPATATIVLKRTDIFDPMIGCNAASLLIPKGWKMEGGIEWRQHPFYPATGHSRIFDPAGDAAEAAYPMLIFCDGIRESSMSQVQFLGPDAIQFMQNAWHEGSFYMGSEAAPAGARAGGLPVAVHHSALSSGPGRRDPDQGAGSA